ncbi:MAG: hypothetical protein KJ871_09340 [Alphaproteobacteria bacterium]|nr:hypothetical protein [Alphaproteobacteria bacterium]MBU2082751.1 hypothetical protein [Alphaproteobacteria bacterium]MBU2143364.1 hypothetical protein [Alphaproteobacteria bacterium]MBU2196805.1 hypothetical protein [Alphaproteobacteria bacterium]
MATKAQHLPGQGLIALGTNTGNDIISSDTTGDYTRSSFYGLSSGFDDFIHAGGGDDIIYADGGADTIDGGAGFDTVNYVKRDLKLEFLINGIEKSDAENPIAASFVGFVTTAGLLKDVSPKDQLFGIERIIGGPQDDKFVIGMVRNDIELDGAGGEDTLDFSDYKAGVDVSITSNGLRITGSDDVTITLKNFEKFEGTSKADLIRSSAPGLIIHAGGENDEIHASGPGSIVYSGSGEDKVFVSGLATLFADATAEDSIGYLSRKLSGALGWGETSDKGSVVNLSQGVRYTLNTVGELIVEGLAGQKLFIANYIGGPGAAFQTAGIYVGNQVWNSYRLADGGFPGGSAYIQGMKEVLDAIYTVAYGEDAPHADPLILDFDGDGLELSALSSVSPYFDTDGDGFAERTGWTYGGDGFLALDANSDGIINDGSELFGDADSTGFEELATYDLNLDGVIDASDAVFGSLRVWRDDNGDAVTDAGELLTLADLGITAINLPAAVSDPVMQAGNVIGNTSTFELAGGELRQVADVVFGADQVNSEFLGDTTISIEAQALPELKGYGEVPSLRIAATLEPGLVSLISATAASGTSVKLTDISATIRPLLTAWTQPDYSGQGQPAADPQLPYTIHYQYEIDELGTVSVSRFVYAAQKTVDDVSVTYYVSSDGAAITAAIPGTPSLGEAMAWLELEAEEDGGFVGTFGANQVNTLEKLTGIDVPMEDIFGDPASGALDVFGLQSASGAERQAMRQYIETHANIEVRVGATFAVQSGLAGYFPDIAYNADKDVFEATTGTELKAAYEAILGDAPATAAEALQYLEDWSPILKVFLAQYDRGEDFLQNSFSYQFANLVRGFEALPTFALGIDVAAAALGIPGALIGAGTAGADIIYLSNGNETVNGGKGIDSYVFGANFTDVVIDDLEAVSSTGAAPDNIRFAVHDVADVVATRDGNDLIMTIAATNQSVVVKDQFLRERFSALGTRLDDDRGVVEIVFADGVVWDEFDIAKAVSHPLASDDTMVGTRHVDWLDGGAGDDLLSGGNSTDVYIYDIGYGDDTIHEYGPDITEGNGIFILLEGDDVVRFGDGLTLSDLDFIRIGSSNDLVITIVSTGETLTIVDQLKAHNTGPFGVLWYDRVESFSFDADGSLISWEDVLHDLVLSTDGDDAIYGFYYKDKIDGGAGDDYLSGGDDADTYYFGRGDGNDTIEDAQTNILTSAADRIVFKEGISVEDVSFTRDGATEDLLVTIEGSSDSIRIVDQYDVVETGVFGAHAFDQIEIFEWADGTIRNWSDLRQPIIDAAATSGDDVIYGSHVNDTFSSSYGNDRLEGGNGSDTYIYVSGTGDDTIFDYASNILASDNDRLVFSDLNSSDIVLSRQGTSGNDLVLRHAASSSSITIEGQFWYTTLNIHFYEIETIEFADGETWSTADTRLVWLAQNSTSGSDTVTGFWSNDLIDAGSGDDILSGGDGADTYVFDAGYGSDIIRESVGNVAYSDDDTLQFGAGLSSGDVIFSRSGDDLIVSFSGLPDQVTIEGQFTSSAYFGSWTDIENFIFADGTTFDALEMQVMLLAQQSTAGDDTIEGFYTADIIQGGAGNDTLKGSSGGDTYLFNLGDGNDVIIDKLEGHLFLDGPDTVIFGAGIARSDVTFVLDGDDLLVNIVGGDSIRIQDQVTGDFTQIETFQFADGTILTAEEAEINAAAGQATAGDDDITGSQYDDVIQGGTGNDILRGKGGSDTYVFRLGDGQDTIDDGGGYDSTGTADTLSFGPGIASDMVTLARSGNDLIVSIDGTSDQVLIEGNFETHGYNYLLNWQMVERIAFADGVVWEFSDIKEVILNQSITAGNDVIRGFWTDDDIDGLAGDDELRGSTGGDTYHFGLGSGHDTIFESVDNHLFLDGDDTILFGLGVSIDDLTYGRDGDDLVFTITTSGETLTVNDHYSSTAWEQQVERYQFENGQELTLEEIETRVIDSQATDGDDTIIGSNGQDILRGGLGDDLLRGGDGSDTFVYQSGDGDDRIEEPSSSPTAGDHDTIVFGEGILVENILVERTGPSLNDVRISFDDVTGSITISGQLAAAGPTWNESWRSVELFQFADGTVMSDVEIRKLAIASQVTDGNDTIYGTYTSDVVRGGPGDDFLDGQARNDVYLYEVGDGNDTVHDNGNSVSIDTLRFAPGLGAGDLTFQHVGEDLLITVTETGHTITIINQFDTAPNGYNYDWIEAFEFADGSVLDHAGVTQRSIDDSASAGTDSLVGYRSDDVFDGLAGDDALSGLQGNDTYIVALGGGNDVIADAGSSSADVIAFQAGIGQSDVAFEIAGVNLIINLLSSGEQIVVADQFSTASNANVIELFRFDDGSELTNAQVENVAYVAPISYPTPTIVGSTSAETLNGTSGDDVLFGAEGDDTLQGNDGDDIYVWRIGDGSDEINERGFSADTADLDSLYLSSVNVADVEFSRTGNDLLVAHLPTGAVISVDDHFKGSAYGVEHVEFDDGTTYDTAALAGLAWHRGTSGAETLDGSTGDNILLGGQGDDTLQGSGGNDTYIWRVGDGNDVINERGYGSDADDTDILQLIGVLTSETEFARSGNDLLVTHLPSGAVIRVDDHFKGASYGIEGVSFDDGISYDATTIADLAWIRGTAASETLNGTSGDDILLGAAGDDTVQGSDGDDTYIWRVGDGNDVINERGYPSDSADTDSLKLVGVLSSDVAFSQSGSDLLITHVPSGAVISVDTHFSGSKYGIELVTFDDGTELSASDIQTLINGGLPPVIFDIDGDGSYLSGAAVRFDFDTDTQVETGTWIDAGDSVLALDRNLDGVINNGSEISFTQDLVGARTDLEGLAAFDTNSDGLLSAADEMFDAFYLWNDANGNGVSEGHELRRAGDAGLLALNLSSHAYLGAEIGQDATIFGETTAWFADGSRVNVADAKLGYTEIEQSEGAGGERFTLPFEVQKLDLDLLDFSPAAVRHPALPGRWASDDYFDFASLSESYDRQSAREFDWSQPDSRLSFGREDYSDMSTPDLPDHFETWSSLHLIQEHEVADNGVWL